MRPPLSRAAIAGWVLFDFAAQPVFTLVTTFIFAPFFAARLAADPVQGQALWGFATGAAGIAIALFSPVLGAIADAAGSRKPWIAFFSLLLVAGCTALWWAVPGSGGAVALALFGFFIATIGAEFATVFTNAMMPDLAPPERLGRLSGTGWAIGYVGGLLSLALMLAFFVADPHSGRTLAGWAPAFGLDPVTGGGDRASGPFSALWYLVFVAPLFLWTPDVPRRLPLQLAVGRGLSQLGSTLRGLSRTPRLARYLLAHMVYVDALVALFAFGGLYATGIFGWSTVEIGAFGILLTVAGTAGAFLGGALDDRFGPKPVVMTALVILFMAAGGILSLSADRALFVIPITPPQPGDGLFSATGERLYLAFGLVIGSVAGALQAASRTLLVRLAGPAQMTEAFGLYALSGKMTSFLCPLAVGVLTAWSGSQRIGMSVLLVFFAAGAALLAPLRMDKERPRVS